MKSKLSIIITNEAKNDINGIVAYISPDNKVAGLNFAKYLKKMFVYMLEFPNIGKKDQNIQMRMFCFLLLSGVITLFIM